MWAVMFFGPIAHFSRLAGGASPFDIRPMGYSYDEAYAFLNAIGEQGRRYYANRELLLDMFYPPLYAISRGLALWWLTMPGACAMRRCRSAGVTPSLHFRSSWRALIWLKMATSRECCRHGPILSHDLVHVSSSATRMKMIAGGMTELLMAMLAILWLVRRSLTVRRLESTSAADDCCYGSPRNVHTTGQWRTFRAPFYASA